MELPVLHLRCFSVFRGKAAPLSVYLALRWTDLVTHHTADQGIGRGLSSSLRVVGPKSPTRHFQAPTRSSMASGPREFT